MNVPDFQGFDQDVVENYENPRPTVAPLTLEDVQAAVANLDKKLHVVLTLVATDLIHRGVVTDEELGKMLRGE